jgi:hypothetical protein
MKSLTFTLILIIQLSLISCKGSKEQNPLLGKWIIQNTYKAPSIIEFREDYFFELHQSENRFMLYVLNKDTLLSHFTYSDNIRQDILEFSNNTLTFYYDQRLYELGYPVKDNFEKLTQGNYLEYVNEKLNLSISVPQIYSEPIKWRYMDNFIYLSKSSDDKLILNLNGEIAELDSTLPLKIFEGKKNSHESSAYCFIDVDIKNKDLEALKIALRKAGYSWIECVSVDKSNELCQSSIHLPRYGIDYPLEFRSDLGPPLPPLPKLDYKNFFKKGIVCKYTNEKLFVNKEVSSINKLKEEIRNRLINETLNKLAIYFDGDVTYKNYLLFTVQLKKYFRDLRNEYVLKNYGVEDFNSLNNETSNEVSKNFRLGILEITDKELEEILN